MKTKLSNTLGITFCLFAMVLLGAGCGAKTGETQQGNSDVSSIPDSLTFETKDATSGVMSGNYEYNGYTVHFDVVRGGLNPIEELGPDSPRHAIDVRICDEKHFCFAEQAGGHAFASSTWADNTNEENVPDDARGLKNFQTSWQLHQKLLRLGQGEFMGLEEEYRALMDVTNHSPGSLTEPPPPNQLNERTLEKSVLSIKPLVTTYTQQFQIWTQPVVWIAQHSSMFIKVLTSGGTPISTYATCNHGSCGSSSGMTFKCSNSFSDRPSTIPVRVQCAQPHTNGTMHPGGDGCCTTQYNITPGVVSHVCNDDTRLQRDFMIAGAPMSKPYCGDTTVAAYAPNCS
ncbi:MAG: hypothetical protein WC477_00055 [Patescibacteria group bacterium]